MENDALSRRAFLRAGTAGAAAAGTAGTAAAQEGTETGTSSGGGGSGGMSTQEVTVGPGGSLVFEPAELTITPGTTVRWVWDSNNHNVAPESTPEGANWGGEGSSGTTFDSGHEYSHTFDTLGTYEYVCTPHASAGMAGSIEVVESIETPAPTGPAVPDGAKSLIVATTFAMIATLMLAFFFLKFGGDSPKHEAE
ncbi:plastocyanin/azurin family copper-binding protein [Halolamina sp.]|jgi:plastocyanin|uniref:plastocyanin/azurin family copper-binding protein n=1 Tax=Halolamina sp. TaxID=1940283 RepID=UPI000223B8FB|nr:blue (type 1) copper domain protein [halophilic archaeon DL31]